MKASLFLMRYLGMMLLLSALGCATTSIQQSKDRTPLADQPMITSYILQPGDNVDIKFFHNPELNENVTIRPDGKISLQLIDEVIAAGLNPAQLDDVLTQKYGRQLKTPVISVIVKTFEGQRVYVGGEVRDPQVLVITGSINALQAIFRAGGFTSDAKLSSAVIIRRGANNRPIAKVVNLEKALKGGIPESEYQLLPYDMLYVPRTAIARMDQFMTHLYSVIPRNIGLGFTYEIHAEDAD